MASEPTESRTELCGLAATQRRAGRVPEALETLKRAESLYPPFGSLFEELGFCLLAMSAPAKALAPFERAVSINMCLLGSWRALANLYGASGQAAEAQKAADRVAQLSALPGEILLACRKYFDGEVAVAEDLVRRYIVTHGEHVEALRLLGRIAADSGAEFPAQLLLQRALAVAPDHEVARHELSLVLLRRQKHEEARAELTKLLAAVPGDHNYRSLYATAVAGIGDYQKALPLYGELLKEAPRDAQLYLSIGNALRTTGKTPEAIDAYHYAAAAAETGFGEAFWGLANLKTYRFKDAEIVLMQQRESNPATAPVDRIHLCFALGKALEDRSRFGESFEYYERGNVLKKATLRYRPERLEGLARRQMSLCTPGFFAARKSFGCDSAAPIFIVGMPRSGSTLIEQILASHSQVEGTLELANIPRLAQELRWNEGKAALGYPEVLTKLSADDCRDFGAQYLRETAPYRTGSAGAPLPRFTDKMPNNFQYVDLIHLILPNAKIIDVRREPLACGFSNFKQLFANGQRFAYGLEDIGRFYRMYVGLMDHWDRVLPGKVLRVQYEDVVHSLEPAVRRMLDFCGLEFEPACLEFHRSRRHVHTPSSEQVHQPLYKEGLDHWRNFERWLTPLKRALASDGNA